jgi:hypothetical protein
MRRTKHQLIQIALKNVRVGLKLIKPNVGYSDNVIFDKKKFLTALSSILESLAVVFCELARHQSSGAEKKYRIGSFSDEIKLQDIVFSTKKFLQKCARFLKSEKLVPRQQAPFTAMYTRAQTLAFEICMLCETKTENKLAK